MFGNNSMSANLVRVRELAAWGFDNYEYRPKTLEAATLFRIAEMSISHSTYEPRNAVLLEETNTLREMFLPYAQRQDLLLEMSGLSWSLGVVDLRSLIAFQRRLTFNGGRAQPSAPNAQDWPSLFAFSFGSSNPIEHEATYDRSTNTITLHSENPNLHACITKDPAYPLSIHAGGPFFEVAHFRDRWFLRDGYHRAYALLKAGAFQVPAIVVEATTLNNLGADQPWFFPEHVLFSDTPPRVIDFLDTARVIEYERPPLIKTLRITIEETLNPVVVPGEQT